MLSWKQQGRKSSPDRPGGTRRGYGAMELRADISEGPLLGRCQFLWAQMEDGSMGWRKAALGCCWQLWFWAWGNLQLHEWNVPVERRGLASAFWQQETNGKKEVPPPSFRSLSNPCNWLRQTREAVAKQEVLCGESLAWLTSQWRKRWVGAKVVTDPAQVPRGGAN